MSAPEAQPHTPGLSRDDTLLTSDPHSSAVRLDPEKIASWVGPSTVRSDWADLIRSSEPSPYFTPYYDQVIGARLVLLSPLEMEIIKSPIFERLAGIRQMSAFSLTSAGQAATHSRLQHSIGAMELCSQAGQSLVIIATSDKSEQISDVARGLPPRELQLLRLCGLLHDASHLAFSHSLEHTEKRLNLYYDHDEELGNHLRRLGVESILERHNREFKISLDDILACFHKGHPYGAIVKAFGDRGDYLIRDACGAGRSAEALTQQLHVTRTLARNLVLKMNGDFDSTSIQGAELGVRKNEEGVRCIHALAQMRSQGFAQMCWAPATELAREFLVSALERSLRCGLCSSEQLLDIASNGNDEALVGVLLPQDQISIRTSRFDEQFRAVFSFTQADLRDEQRLLREDLDELQETVRAYLAGVVDEGALAVAHTWRDRKDLCYKTIDLDGRVERIEIGCELASHEKHFFVALLNEVPHTTRQLVEDKLKFLFNSYLKEGCDTSQNIFRHSKQENKPGESERLAA